MGLFKRSKPLAQKSYTTYDLMPNQMSWTAKWSTFDARKAINEGYQRSTWVYSCVRLRASNIAQVKWVVERQAGEEWEEVHGPLDDLLRRPNPTFDLTDMMRRAVYWMDLSGDAYFTKVRNGAGRIIELWPLIPDKMEIMPGRDAMIYAYRYQYGGRTYTIPAEDILHLRYANPGSLYYGLSPLQAAARAVDIDEEAERWQKISLQNMAVPPGAFVLEGESIGQTEYESAKRWVAEQSGPENARKPWVLGNAKWQSMAQNAVDLDFTEGRKMTREEICSAFSVPPPLVGIYENATLANIETARQILWREGLIPVLDEIEGQLNVQLVREYGDLRIRYDLSNVEALADNYNEKLDSAQKLWAMGVPLTEINRRLEMGLMVEEIVGADKGYLQGGLLPTDFDAGDFEPGGRDAARVAFGDDTE